MEIKASELRIGNYVLSIFDKIETINGIIGFPAEKTKDANPIYHNLITVNENGNQYNLAEIKPIPLTEQWLIDFKGRLVCDNNDSGFKVIQLWINNFLLETIIEDGFIHHSLSGERIKLPYVHQLQNLYHSLTGKELTK